jgi:SAM-dependent methyltransferase
VQALAQRALAALGGNGDSSDGGQRHVHSHGHGHNHGHSHGHGHGGGDVPFADAAAWAERFDTPARDEYMQPERVVAEVIAPLLPAHVQSHDQDPISASSSARRPTVADIGAGTGYMTARLARLLPGADVVAADTQAGMCDYLQRRVEKEGLVNVRVQLITAAAPSDGPRLGVPVDVALLVHVYHHIGDVDTPRAAGQRIAYLRALARELAPGGAIVILEHKPGELPIEAPPAHMRLERSTILSEAEAAGLELAEAPSFLPWHSCLVFKAAGAVAP